MSTPNTPDGYPPYQGGGNPFEQTQPSQPPSQPPSQSPYNQPEQSPYNQPEQSPYSQPQQSPFSQPQQSPFSQPKPPAFGQEPSFGQQPAAYGQPLSSGQPPSYGEQPPSFGQPPQPYSQPPAAPPMGMPMGMPVPPPPAPPAKKSRRGLWTTLAIIAGVLILVCALVGVLVIKPLADKGSAIVAAATTAGTFCGDLKVQNFSAAYDQLSSAYQAKLPQDQFTQGAQLHDTIDGQVSNCGTPNSSSSSGVSINDANTQVTLAVTITRAKTYTGNIVLVKTGSVWKIDSIADSLQGTDLGPLQTANAFCAALIKGDTATAYNLFSSSYQAKVGSESAYDASFKAAFAGTGITLKGCTPDLKTYSVSGATATLKSSLDLTLNGVTTSVPTTLTFALENGAWKIDNVDIPQA